MLTDQDVLDYFNRELQAYERQCAQAVIELKKGEEFAARQAAEIKTLREDKHKQSEIQISLTQRIVRQESLLLKYERTFSTLQDIHARMVVGDLPHALFFEDLADILEKDPAND